MGVQTIGLEIITNYKACILNNLLHSLSMKYVIKYHIVVQLSTDTPENNTVLYSRNPYLIYLNVGSTNNYSFRTLVLFSLVPFYIVYFHKLIPWISKYSKGYMICFQIHQISLLRAI